MQNKVISSNFIRNVLFFFGESIVIGVLTVLSQSHNMRSPDIMKEYLLDLI